MAKKNDNDTSGDTTPASRAPKVPVLICKVGFQAWNQIYNPGDVVDPTEWKLPDGSNVPADTVEAAVQKRLENGYVRFGQPE